LKSAYWAYKRT